MHFGGSVLLADAVVPLSPDCKPKRKEIGVGHATRGAALPDQAGLRWNAPYCVRCAVATASSNSVCIAEVMSPSVVTEKNSPGVAQLCMTEEIWL